MVKTFSCWWLPLICQLWSSSKALSLDALVNQSGIFPLNEAEQQLRNAESLKLIVHGYLGSRTHSSIMPLRNAYEAQGIDNILVADWAPAAGLDYATSRRAVRRVAIVLAKELQQLVVKHNVSLGDVHIIGHSLGAHIAGKIGHYFNGNVGRVTGLDPALPLFTPHSDDSLQPNAAQFVDVIHTDYPFFGDLTPRGTVDFYPNFGHTPQPGCDEVDLLSASKLLLEAYSCSHNRAVLFYAESIGLPKSFPAIPCTWQLIRGSKSCLLAGQLNESELVYMGEQVTRSATSYYYLATNAAPPFGQGVHTNFD